MAQTKQKLGRGEPALGGWIMIGHPSIGELMAGEGFDWLCVDMEHTPIDYQTFENIARAVKGSGCDILARLGACEAVQAKRVLDAGADGIIVPMVNSREMARQAVSISKFPPQGCRGAAFSRASDFGRDFDAYVTRHNKNVIVVVMIEHITAVENADEIVATPGVDAVFIGPYDLSTSMGLHGQVDHKDVRSAQEKVLEACKTHGVAAGIHVVAVDPSEVTRRIEEGFRFIACSIDTQFIIHGSRAMLGRARKP